MKRILVALDGSDQAEVVLRSAVELARKEHGRLRLLRAVCPQPEVPPLGGTGVPVPFATLAVMRAARSWLDAVYATVPAELRDGLEVELGTASNVICDVARRYDADLVIIGAHRHGALRRALGTTAARVVDHLDRAVLVIRPIAGAVSLTA